tara:strand:+ start:680 stop:1894 length:1215 start_codon:yes stop_codon:yes gene_type:complete
MTNFNSKVYFYFSSLISLLLFIPVFINSNIGSDWDSYALIGTYENFIKYNTYIPSRPPGFPTYELLIGLLIYVSEILGTNKEQLLLFFHFLLLISFNYLIYCFFKQIKNSNFLIYLIIIFSPIYLISGLSIIDYFFGNLFGFLAIYLVLYLPNQKYQNFYVIIALSLSISSRLSNLIFLGVIFLYILIKNNDFKLAILVLVSTLIISSTVYFYFYSNLFAFYKISGIYSSWTEMFCIFNLTNTDHDLINRLGRFVLKQVPFLGTLGSMLLLTNFLKLDFDIKNKKFYFFLLFLLFELSFLRLPTEEGHLIPAFIAFMFLISKSKNKALIVILISVMLSNFYDLKFYEVDKIDSASTINLSLNIKEGFLIEDYNLRNTIALEKLFHYKNSQVTLYDAWSSGCPNI